jgi:protein-tyrosine phosphatase
MERPTQQVEMHCHCLPGIDDGPQDMDEAVALCRQIVREGTDTVVATPHMLGPYGRRNSADIVRTAVGDLQRSLDEADVVLTVLPGGEVRLDEQMVELLETDQILTLADRGAFLLIELLEVVTVLDDLFETLMGRGVTPVIAHAELVWWLDQQPQTLRRWQSMGVVIQVNAGSLLGQSGRRAGAVGWQMVEGPGAVAVSSDAHNTKQRPPCLHEAMAQIGVKLGQETARRVCHTAPCALLGKSPT